MSNAQLETAIEAAWEARDTITPSTGGETREAIEATLHALQVRTAVFPVPFSQGARRSHPTFFFSPSFAR